MKKFNVNDYMYIQITEDGWKHLEKTVGIDYINACIKRQTTLISLMVKLGTDYSVGVVLI